MRITPTGNHLAAAYIHPAGSTMGRRVTAGGLSVLFLLVVVAVEVWVYSMERNRRVRALRLHVLSFHQLLVSAGGWYVWRRVTRVFRSGSKFLSASTAVRALLMAVLGSAQFSVMLGLLFVDREPAIVTRISNTCIGISAFLFTSLTFTDLASYCIRKTFFPSIRGGGKRSDRSEGRWKLLVALVAAVGLSFGGLLGVAQFTVEKLNIPIRGLSPSLNGTTVVQLSDIHLGGYSGQSTLQRIVELSNQLEPDFVVITGDLVDGAVVFLREIVQPLHGLRGKHGVFFATGNHEYYTGDVDNWIAELPKLGVTPLINSRVCLLGREGEEGECVGGIYLAGLEDITTRNWGIYGQHHLMDLEAALGYRTSGTPTLVLAHQPRAALETIQWSDVRLTLAGHTHAGQFFPFTVLVYLFNPFFVGLYEPRPGVFVYVSPGTVYYWIPFRHYRPEITHFTLISA